ANAGIQEPARTQRKKLGVARIPPHAPSFLPATCAVIPSATRAVIPSAARDLLSAMTWRQTPRCARDDNVVGRSGVERPAPQPRPLHPLPLDCCAMNNVRTRC